MFRAVESLILHIKTSVCTIYIHQKFGNSGEENILKETKTAPEAEAFLAQVIGNWEKTFEVFNYSA